jgi:hypothetical protein
MLFCLLATTTAFGQQLPWIPFTWADGKSAMLVPVTLDNLPHKLEMQLDLGAVTTMVYGKSLAPYLTRYSALQAKFDTTQSLYIQSQKNGKLLGVDLRLGEVDFGSRNLGFFKNFGDSLTAEALAATKPVHVGTIAPDLFQNRVLVIDYPHQRLCVTDQVPAEYAKATFQPFKLKRGRIKIPLQIAGQTEDLLFDTGSSLFALLTTRARALAATNGAIRDSIKTSTWGKEYYVYGRRPSSRIYFGKQRLAKTLVFADNLHTFDKFFANEDMWGVTGNAFFWHNTVIIDYQNQVFGVH